MNQVVFISSLQNEDAKETALQFAADGCHVYGAYTDGAALPCDGLKLLCSWFLTYGCRQPEPCSGTGEQPGGKADILVLKAGLHAEK